MSTTEQLARLWGILDEVKYKDWWMRFGIDGGQPWFQWNFNAPCAVAGGEPKIQPCRKHRLSVHMTEGEVVQSAFAAALQAEEHECREFFQYKNKRVFGPHISIDALLEVADRVEGRA